jgi:hypothetical protein
LYQTGLPNVIIDDLNINYGNYKIRAATYGRGVWQCDLKKQPGASGIPGITANTTSVINVFPNPTGSIWNLQFLKQKPANYTVKVSDISGRTVYAQKNSNQVDASKLADGVYNIEVSVGDTHYNVSAVKQ